MRRDVETLEMMFDDSIREPVIISWPEMEIDPADVMRRLGEQNGPVNEGVRKRLDKLLNDPETAALIQPRTIFRTFGAAGKETNDNDDSILLRLDNGVGIEGTLIARRLPRLGSIVIAFCTIGEPLEKKSRELANERQVLNGLILDAAGSAAVDRLVIETGARIHELAQAKGLAASSPLFPGMKGLGLDMQPLFHRLVEADRINIEISSGKVLYPLKSTSMVMGIGDRMPRWEKKHECAICSMRESCPYRKR